MINIHVIKHIFFTSLLPHLSHKRIHVHVRLITNIYGNIMHFTCTCKHLSSEAPSLVGLEEVFVDLVSL